MEKLNEIERQLDSKLSSYPIFEQVEKRVGIRKTHLVGIASGLTLSIPLTFLFPGLLLAALSLGYPLWATAWAAGKHRKAEDVQWLAFWLCYGLLILTVDILAGPILKRLFPSSILVSLARTLFLVFLYAPPTRGATLAWHKILRPILLKAEASLPGLARSPSGKSSLAKDKISIDVDKAVNYMRTRSKSGSDEA
jgi:receptor expression-enhancing protein 5/6